MKRLPTILLNVAFGTECLIEIPLKLIPAVMRNIFLNMNWMALSQGELIISPALTDIYERLYSLGKEAKPYMQKINWSDFYSIAS
jgi:hypothetical protein